MKKAFSTQWKGSRQPRKQRKYRAKSPLHIRHRFLSSNLSKELRKRHGRRSIEVRKGDSVRIMRGEFKRKTGKVDRVDLKRTRINIQGIQRAKKDGTKISVWFAPSNLQITELNMDDKERLKSKTEKSENKGQGLPNPILENKEKNKKEKKDASNKRNNT
ncbi:50S ribosomal protein L24 [Candidatus Pacearchaeota archaeon]|nr:50S ribosomal protein L24 [Candidatus Pacearchaeota archaeon]